jgi:GDSL-like Lipase/Acylhydrolase family
MLSVVDGVGHGTSAATSLASGPMLSRWDPGPPGAPTVAIVGDSIIHSSAAEIVKSLEGSCSFAVRAQTGAKTRDVAGFIDSLVARPDFDPDVIVVHVGTNDVTGRTPDWRTHWITLMGRTAMAPWLVLFTINHHSNAFGKQSGDGPRAEDINREVSRVGGAPNVKIVDWNAAVQSDVELVWDRAVHRGDFVHPSAKGRLWIAQQIQAVVRDCSGDRPNQVR